MTLKEIYIKQKEEEFVNLVEQRFIDFETLFSNLKEAEDFVGSITEADKIIRANKKQTVVEALDKKWTALQEAVNNKTNVNQAFNDLVITYSEISSNLFLEGTENIPVVKEPVSLTETTQYLSELKVDVDSLRTLQDAVQKLQQISTKFPQLATLKGTVYKLQQSLGNVIKQKGGLFGGGAIEAKKSIARANIVYDALFEFFTEDLQVVLTTELFAPAQQDPDKPIMGISVELAKEAEKYFMGRLQPSRLSNILRLFKPNLATLLDIKRFSFDLTHLSFNQLKELNEVGRTLPNAKQVDSKTAITLQQPTDDNNQTSTPNDTINRLIALANGPNGKEAVFRVLQGLSQQQQGI